jgi:hypothetical protein
MKWKIELCLKTFEIKPSESVKKEPIDVNKQRAIQGIEESFKSQAQVFDKYLQEVVKK